MNPQILITTSSFDLNLPEIKKLQEGGYEIVLNPHKRRLSEEEVRELLTDKVVGMIAGVEPLTQSVIEGVKNLKVISRCGTGLDSVDLAAAQAKGITVRNTPGAPAQAVAELTIGLMLNVLRGISHQDRSIRASGWDRPKGNLLGKRTVGLIGFGHIGSKVAQFLNGFGSDVLAFDSMASEKKSDLATFVTMDELLSRSDIISLHIPYSKDVQHLLDGARLKTMKKGAIVINTARGGLIDEAALYDLLKSGHLAGAGVDVFEEEPYQGPLKDLDNVVLTAHTGSYAVEARTEQERQAAQNLIDTLKLV